ncbi:MAG: CHAT domain-containing protein [Rhodospirillales bacterium]
MKRAEAYMALAKGDNAKAFLYAELARQKLKANVSAKDGQCGQRHEAWRSQELDVISATSTLRLGDLNKAESYARTGATEFNMNGSVFKRRNYQLLSQVKLRQGRFQDALSFALMAKKAQRKSCVPLIAPERAEVNRDIAMSLAALNEFDEAYNVMQEIKSNLKTEPKIWNNMFASSVERGVILRETGHINEAKAVFVQAESDLGIKFGENHYFTAEARMLRALLDDSIPHETLTNALKSLLASWKQRSGQLTSDQSGQSLRLKWIVEDFLVRAFEQDGNIKALTESFEIAETLRSGMVQQALVQTALRRLAPDENARALVRRQQDFKKKLGVLRQRLQEGRNFGQVGIESRKSLKKNIVDTESAIAQLTDKVRAVIPNYDQVVGINGFKLEQATQALKSDEAIVSLLSGRRESFIWVITADGQISGQKIAKTKDQWEDDVAAMRANVELPGGKLSDLENFDGHASYNIYRDLLEPLEAHWSPAKHVIFVADNALASIPMGMLLRKDVIGVDKSEQMFAGFKKLPWLIRSHAVSMAPSVSSFALLRKTEGSNDQRLAFMGVGDPIFDPLASVADVGQSRGGTQFALRAVSKTRGLTKASLASLPRLLDTADEINAIADVVGADFKRDIFLGNRANEAEIRNLNASGALRKYRILSFATHGLIPGDLDGLMSPALALSAPSEGSSEPWDDGLLTAEEIMELDLNADWAILSACNTASAETSSTEAFSGLGRAFFYAGARSLLLSNWPVFSDSTRQLMVSLFKHEATSNSRAQALRAAMLAIMDKGEFDDGKGLKFSYAHPLFWAPFTLVGDG